MTQLNSQGNSQESTETSKKKPKDYNVHSLLKQGIDREFWDPFDPQKFDSYKVNKGGIYSNISRHMRDLRREGMEEWWEITDDMIDGESTDANISEQIILKSKNLVLKRKQVYDTAMRTFPSIRTQGNDWERILRDEISSLDENVLDLHIKRWRKLKTLVYDIFPSLRALGADDMSQFSEIFHDKDALFDETGKKKLLQIFKDYKDYGQVPDKDSISFILSKYQSASPARRKEVLTWLGAQFSLKFAHDMKLVGDSFVKDVAKKEFGDIFTTLTSWQQEDFIRTLTQSTSTIVEVKDLDDARLWEIFGDNGRRKAFAQEVFQSLGVDISNTTKADLSWDIAREIRERKIAEAQEKWESDDYDLFDEFVEELSTKLKTKDGASHVRNLKLLKTPWAVIQYEHEDGSTQYVRVKRVRDDEWMPLDVENDTKSGIELEGLSIVDGKIVQNQNFSVSYDDLYSFLAEHKNPNVLKSTDFDALLTTNPDDAGKDGKIYDARLIIDEDPVTAANIAGKLDIIDSIGSKFGFEEGTAFIAPVNYDDKAKNKNDGVWTIAKIRGNSADIMDPGWIVSEKWVPLAELYNLLISTPGFQRIAKIKGNEDMLKELSEYWAAWAKLDDAWRLFIETSEDDGHGHAKKSEKEITCFESEKWGHIRLEFIKDGMVRFWEYDPKGEDESAVKAYAKKHGPDKKMKWLYKWKRMSYPAFLRYLEDQGLSATTEDKFEKESWHDLHSDEHEHLHSHLKGSLLKRIMKWQNPASIWKGFEMLYHSIEHTLEKWAKLDAARFAMGTARMVGAWESAIGAQLYADITTASKEILEKYEQKIFGLPGPAGRWKCIHIAHNKDSRPEEVMSAVNYMLKSYGHLYAEDIKHYQPAVTPDRLKNAPPWYFAFFDWLVMTSKIGNLYQWRKKAYDRAIKEMGTEDEHEGEPTEEQLIHALCKMIDGDWGEFPYAASVIKAIGWPGGFEKTWKFEGFDNAHKKGLDQTKMVNAQWRLNKSVSYLETHEIYKAMGAMESMAAKTKSPEYQAMPFIWAVWGYSKFSSHAALQKLKWYAENGLSFHAYGFLRSEGYNNVYKETVKLALQHIWGKFLVDEFNKLCKNLAFDQDNPKKTKWAALAMMKFWQENSDKGLHDILQGQNGWLTAKAESGDATVKEYLKIFAGAHAMQLKDNTIPSGEFGMDWYKEHGYQNMIFSQWDDWLKSLSSMLNKIHFEGTAPGGRPMNEEHKEKIWNYAKNYMMTGLRDEKSFLGNTELQKKQYMAHRKELIKFFSEKLTARTILDREANATWIIETNIKTYPYYKDLADMGIDPHAVFNGNVEIGSAESDYQRWKRWGSAEAINPQVTIPDIAQGFKKKANNTLNNKRTPTDTIKPKAWPRMKRKDWPKKVSKIIDDDDMIRGWAWDASVQSDSIDHDDHSGI